MGTFKAYLKKESIESWRQYRYIVLAAGFIIFAILDPVMLKLLPYILKNQVPAEMAALLTMKITPIQGVANYIKDLIQILPLFIILGLMGSLADEIKQQKLVFPYSKGTRASSMVLAKFLHYTGFVALSCLVGFFLNWYYVNTLFEGETVALSYMMVAGMLFAVFYACAIALLFLVSSWLKRGIAAALLVIFSMYIATLFTNFQSLAMWVPNTLHKQALLLGEMNGALVGKTLCITILYIIIFLWLTIRRMRQVEVV